MTKPVYLKLIEMYNNYGYRIRTGLNPHQVNHPLAPFTAVYKDDEILTTGGGISLQEVYFLECLFSDYQPKNIFCIGNAFGWSSIAISLLNPNANVVCIDAGIEGKDNNAGIELTNRMANNEGLNLTVIKGFSPDDVDHVVKDCLDDTLDFVFIDGMHTNEQLLKDYNAITKHIHPDSIILFHDVLMFEMEKSFDEIVYDFNKQHCILHRTESGMGILLPLHPSTHVLNVIDAFTESHKIIDDYLYKKKTVIKLITALKLMPLLNAIKRRI